MYKWIRTFRLHFLIYFCLCPPRTTKETGTTSERSLSRRTPEYILSIKYYKRMRYCNGKRREHGERVANGWVDYGSRNSHIIHNIHSKWQSQVGESSVLSRWSWIVHFVFANAKYSHSFVAHAGRVHWPSMSKSAIITRLSVTCARLDFTVCSLHRLDACRTFSLVSFHLSLFFVFHSVCASANAKYYYTCMSLSKTLTQ